MSEKVSIPNEALTILDKDDIDDSYYQVLSALENYYCCLSQDETATKAKFDALNRASDALNAMRDRLIASERAKSSLVCALKNITNA